MLLAAAGPGEKNSQFAGGFNACQLGRLSPYFETYFAALNTPQYDDSLCGRCAAVRGTGGRATGKIVVVKIVGQWHRQRWAPRACVPLSVCNQIGGPSVPASSCQGQQHLMQLLRGVLPPLPSCR